MVLLARSGDGAQAAGMVGQAVAATRQAAYSRQLEMEADTLGARYMAAAGYDPKGAIAFLKTLDQERALNPIDVPGLHHEPSDHSGTGRQCRAGRPLPRTEPAHGRKIASHLKKDPDDHSHGAARPETVVAEYGEIGASRIPTTPEQLSSARLRSAASRETCTEAQTKLREIPKARPDNPGSAARLGPAVRPNGRFVNARKAFDRALALEPNEPLNYLYSGRCWKHLAILKALPGPISMPKT